MMQKLTQKELEKKKRQGPIDDKGDSSMSFMGFDEKDGEPLYDTKESAIERAEMLLARDSDPNAKIFVHRKSVPLWFAHLVRETPLRWLAYTVHLSKKEVFAQTLDTILTEAKRQFLNGAQRIVLTRDDDVIFCEPQY